MACELLAIRDRTTEGMLELVSDRCDGEGQLAAAHMHVREVGGLVTKPGDEMAEIQEGPSWLAEFEYG